VPKSESKGKWLKTKDLQEKYLIEKVKNHAIMTK
jgi:hypothetical protein